VGIDWDICIAWIGERYWGCMHIHWNEDPQKDRRKVDKMLLGEQ